MKFESWDVMSLDKLGDNRYHKIVGFFFTKKAAQDWIELDKECILKQKLGEIKLRKVIQDTEKFVKEQQIELEKEIKEALRKEIEKN